MSDTSSEFIRIGIRDFQHNLKKHLVSAKNKPVMLTKHRRDHFLVADADTYELKKRCLPKRLSLDLEFFGMYKNRKDWKGKSSTQILKELRREAWGER